VAELVVVCTGNAARSVMAGAILAERAPGLRVTTAGTHVIEGMPMSWRTRDALKEIGITAPNHRSRQLANAHVETADLVVGFAGEHVGYIRRTHPDAAARTGTIRRLVRDLATTGPLPDRLAALGLADVELELWEDVIDPAGGDLDTFIASARDISDLCDQLVSRLNGVT
jgi:protein arginine phosphatase